MKLFTNVSKLTKKKFYNVNWFYNDYTCKCILNNSDMEKMKRIQCRFMKQWVTKLTKNQTIHITLYDTTMQIKKNDKCNFHCYLTKKNCSNNFIKGTMWNVNDVLSWIENGSIPSCKDCDAPYLSYINNKYKCYTCNKTVHMVTRKHVNNVFLLESQ